MSSASHLFSWAKAFDNSLASIAFASAFALSACGNTNSDGGPSAGGSDAAVGNGGAGTGGSRGSGGAGAVNCSKDPPAVVLYDGETVGYKGMTGQNIAEESSGGNPGKVLKVSFTVTGYWADPGKWTFPEVDASKYAYLEFDVKGPPQGCAPSVDFRIALGSAYRQVDVTRYTSAKRIVNTYLHVKIPLADFGGDFTHFSSLQLWTTAIFNFCGGTPAGVVQNAYLDNIKLTGCGQSGVTKTLTLSSSPLETDGNPVKTIQYLGVNHDENNLPTASRRFRTAELEELGTHSVRIRFAPGEMEPTEIDAALSVADIKAQKGANMNWSAWQSSFTSAAYSSKYFAWMDALIQKNGADQPVRLFPTLRPCWRDGDRQCATWLGGIVNTQDGRDKWWKYVFAFAYWANVQKKFGIVDWEFHNEPDAEWADAGGSWSDYALLWQTTYDAVKTANDIAGIEAHVTGPDPIYYANPSLTTMLSSAVAKPIMQASGVSYHDYSGNEFSFWDTWAAAKGMIDRNLTSKPPIWLTEWGTFNEPYGGSCAAGTSGNNTQDRWAFWIANMLFDWTLDGQMKGEHIYTFSSEGYYWGNSFYAGLVANGCKTPSFYAYRQLIRALQGDKTVLAHTQDGATLRALVTRDAHDVWVQITNLSDIAHTKINVDASALTAAAGKSAEVYLFQYDASNDAASVNDEKVQTTTVQNGSLTVDSIPARSMVQVRIVGAGAAS